MKGIFKLMTVALAVGTLASCSDDLIENNRLQVKEGDLVATLPLTEANTRVAVVPSSGNTDFVWSPDDQIQVYKLSSLNYSIYNYVSGAGSETGVFSTEGEGQSGDDLYAVTQPQNSETIYGVSANNDQKAVLTATVEKEYDWETLDVEGGGTGYVVPTPFWGPATIEGSNINVDFKALTGFMKLDLANVPATTEAIVLTTHEDFSIDMGATKINGGNNEPLSGTLNAVLDDDAALQADARLAKYDMIRINIPEHAIAKGYILYIPVIAQHYDKLYVLAVSETGRANYTWGAEILREFDDFTQKVYTDNGKVSISSLTLSEMIDINELGATSWAEASIVIASKAAANPGRTMRYTVDGSTFTDDALYIANNIEKNNVELTITGTANTLKTIAEAEFGSAILSPFSGAVSAATCADLENSDMAKARTVRLNYEVAWPADTEILLPTSNVELSSTVNQAQAIDIFTASTTGVSGYDETVYNAKNAGLIIKGGTVDNGAGKLVPVQYDEIDILANSRGDIYAFEEDTYIKKLVFNGTRNLQNIRLTDALVGEINYANAIDNNEEINIYTTGSAAIGNTGAEAITGSHKNKPAVYAYWTSRSLTDNALALGFDNAFIYTAAQLQGVGLGAGIVEGGGTLTDCPSLIATTAPTAVYEYQISKFVNNIWLGGAKYPWLGAQVAKLVGTPAVAGYGTDRNILGWNDPTTTDAAQSLTTAVVINGNGKRLRNMVISTDDPYFIDPHTCCTTCGDLTVKVTEDLGLFRNIKSTAAVTVKNIYLNDALLDTQYKIDDIGSIVGQIYSGAAVTYENNISTNIRIKAKGDNIGGQVGNAFAASKMEIKNPKNNQEVTETGVNETMVQSEGNNVGGIVGLAASNDAIEVTNPIVKIDWVLADKGSNAGGVIGLSDFVGESFVNGATVEIPSIKATQSDKTESKLRETGKNVGGLVGQTLSEDDVNFEVKGTVSVKSVTEIEAGNQNAGGLIGLATLDDDADAMAAGELKIAANDNDKITVNVGDLTAHNGYAGGYVGNISTGKDALIGDGNAHADNKKISDNVTIASLNSAFAAGGLVGGNSIPVTITSAANNTLNVTINDITNTWEEADFKGISTYSYLAINLDNRLKNCGSFGLLVGLENSKDLTTGLTVTGSKNITTGGTATATTTGATAIMDAYATTQLRTIFSDAKKKAVFFQLHSDTGSTVPDAATDLYWGDVYGYTGYVKGDSYYVVDGTLLQGDQIYNVATQY